jgi:hypothetical protein
MTDVTQLSSALGQADPHTARRLLPLGKDGLCSARVSRLRSLAFGEGPAE